MNDIAAPDTTRTNTLANEPSTRQLVASGAVGGVGAAAATMVVAAIAKAADVGLEVDGAAIPITAFAVWTMAGAAVGIITARLLRQRRRFVLVTALATALSLVPAIAAPDDSISKVVLVATHVLAAAIIIPVLSNHLAAGADAGGDVRTAGS